jgi:hypothetical protein
MPAAGCYTHACDAVQQAFDGGCMVDDSTYETNGFDEDWIRYPPNVTLTVTYPSDPVASCSPNAASTTRLSHRVPVSIEPYVGTSITPNQPNDSGINFTSASGGVVEFSSVGSTGFTAVNSTCALYFARFVVHFAPVSSVDAAMATAVDVGDASADAAMATGVDGSNTAPVVAIAQWRYCKPRGGGCGEASSLKHAGTHER